MAKKLALLMLAFLFAVSGQRGAGAGMSPQRDPAIEELKPNLYVVTGSGGHTTFRVTPDGVIVVDTKIPGAYDSLIAQIKTVTDKPVKYVIVTHHHLDHSGNIGKFVDAGAQVIGHDNLKTNLTAHVPPYAPDRGLWPPNVTYAKKMTLELGGAKVQIRSARAHTSGDSIAYFPDSKVVAAGDCVVGTAPAFDFPFEGSALEWQTLLADIEKLDFDILIPGHSGDQGIGGRTTMTKADFLSFKTKFDTVMARGKDLVSKGTPKAAFVSQLNVHDLGWGAILQQLTAPARLDPFYEELQSGKPRPLQ